MSLLSLVQVMAIGLAGAVGALARYLLGRFVAIHTTSSFPFATLLINLSGAFAIGLLSSLVSGKLLSPVLQLILATGFLGGYTTFSTMSWEGVQLARGGNLPASLFYLSSSFILGLLAAFLGIKLGGWI